MVQTFFLTYHTGSYDSFQEHVYTIDAESKEQLLLEFREAFVLYLEECKNFQKLYDTHIQPIRVNINSSEQERLHYLSAIKLFHSRYGTTPYFIKFRNFELVPLDEEFSNDIDEIFGNSHVNVFSIDEYIENHRPPKVEE